MAKADLHVHSKYSDYPSTWGHKVYNSPESFTAPETVYKQAKLRGMDFVTLTDHDDIRGALELQANHPEDTFISCEVTTFFPEDNCKIHILVFGITEAQYNEIMQIRFNIYELRNYIVKQNLAYSVAHATYDQDNKLQFEHIEKLVVLFDIFEIINGGMDAQNNLLIHQYLQNLDEKTLNELQAKHQLKAISSDPWVKGFTGGSDDHCGILIGTAFTQSTGNSPELFLNSIKNKKSLGNGMHGNFEIYATSVIKHVHDYRLNCDDRYAKSKMNDFFELFFNGHEGNLIKRFRKSQSLRYLKKKNNKTYHALHRLLKQISQDAEHDIASKIPNTYKHINELHDEMFRSVLTAVTKHLPKGDIFKGLQSLSTLFPIALLAAPFIGSMRHQVLKADIKRALIEGTKQHYTEKALWFTDTIDDLNGVSVTLRQIAKHSTEHGYQMKLVTCVDQLKINTPLPDNCLNFPPVKEVEIPGYEQQKIGFPSLLSIMRKITLEQPDQIIISTPGPVGIAAMLCAKLMDLPIKAIYHTDFAEQIMRMSNEPTLAHWTDQLVNIFYQQSDLVFVPSNTYIDKLKIAGLEKDKLHIFPRGLDLDLYSPKTLQYSMTRRKQLYGDFTLLFAGRISEDKNLSLLKQIITKLNRQHPEVFNLVIAGDGPDLTKFKMETATLSNVHFTGRLAPEELINWYCSADLFVFPSHTDTFGMVILEAQACGVPCLVTNSGGPKEIIKAEETGEILYSDEPNEWATQIKRYRNFKIKEPNKFEELRLRCRQHVHEQNNWQPVFDAVLGNRCLLPNKKSNNDSNKKLSTTTPEPNKLAAA